MVSWSAACSYYFVTQTVCRGPFIARQRFFELARLRIAYCLSVCPCFACLTCNITRDVNIELANWLGIVNWCWLLIQPFARQAVRWGPFIFSMCSCLWLQLHKEEDARVYNTCVLEFESFHWTHTRMDVSEAWVFIKHNSFQYKAIQISRQTCGIAH